jgi:predicted HTH domain antitoxin
MALAIAGAISLSEVAGLVALQLRTLDIEVRQDAIEPLWHPPGGLAE